jgi:prevent-host-death family protein
VDIYSIYEAKARFSEIIRKVRAGRRVAITHHGVRVAEILPVTSRPESLAERLPALERDGIVQRAAAPTASIPLVVRRRGALARFLASRD